MTQQQKSKLPPKVEDKVVEVSLKHVVIAFGTVLAGSIFVGTTIVVIRDYSRYRRQKVFFEGLKDLFQTLINLENKLCNERKTAGS